MTVFDTSLESAPITESNLDPILPEERFILELVGFERSDPDQFRKDGGIKWTFQVYNLDGSPFEFQDEPYQLWRTSDKDKNGKPLFNLNTQSHSWACALLGRDLGEADNFSVSELRNKRMSVMIVWRNKRPPAKGKTFDMASLRHVPVGAVGSTNGTTTKEQVSADPSSEDVDRALAVSMFEKKLERAKKKKLPSLQVFVAAYAEIHTASVEEVDVMSENLQDALDAMDD